MYYIDHSAGASASSIASSAASTTSNYYNLASSLNIMATDVQSALQDIDARINGMHVDLHENPMFDDLLRRVEALEGLENRIANLEERINMMDFYTEAS